MNCAEPRLKDSRRVSRGGCCAPARAARNVKCFCRGIGERGGARVRVRAREGYIEELNYYSLINIYPHHPDRSWPVESFIFQAGPTTPNRPPRPAGTAANPNRLCFGCPVLGTAQGSPRWAAGERTPRRRTDLRPGRPLARAALGAASMRTGAPECVNENAPNAPMARWPRVADRNAPIGAIPQDMEV